MELHEANRKAWNKTADEDNGQIEASGPSWRDCFEDPHAIISSAEFRHLESIKGKKICVLGSGDNRMVFAIAGLGAIVTSVDISDSQLNIAKARATEIGAVNITFVQSDVTNINLPNESQDVVYTGGHVAVWVSDIKKYYGEAARILKPGGICIVSEYHPIRRPFIGGNQPGKSLEIRVSYLDHGPHEYKFSELPSYEFNWTISDIIMAIMHAGLNIFEVSEYGDDHEDWEPVDLSGLPLVLLVVSSRPR